MKSRPRPAGGGGGGGIRKRGPTRTDRDGDMEMDASSGRGGKKSRGGPGPVRPAARQPGGRTQGRSKNLDAIQRALVDNAGTSQANVRSGAGRGNSSLEQFIITGWAKSKASTNRDRGVENLVSFLERRMNAQQKGPKVKITKVCLQPSQRQPLSTKIPTPPDLRSSLLFLATSSPGSLLAGTQR